MDKKEKSEEGIIRDINEVTSKIEDLIERNKRLPLLF